MTTLQYKNPFPGGPEIYNFGRSFLRHHNYIFSLSDLFLGVEKKFINFTRSTPKVYTAFLCAGGGGGGRGI